MKNRKDFLKYIFSTEIRKDWKKYYGGWLSDISINELIFNPKLPYINLITYHSFECPVYGYTPFKMGKTKVGFHITYDISSSDIISCFSKLNNADDSYYQTYLDKVSLEKSGADLRDIIYTNFDKVTNRKFDYNKEDCKKNSETFMKEKASGLKSKISYNFYRYDYFDWSIIITNHIARFTTCCNPGGTGSSTKVEVLTTNETEKASFYKVMNEKERKKGIFSIVKTVDELIDLIKKVEVIGTDEEPYDPEYDNQLDFNFSRSKK